MLCKTRSHSNPALLQNSFNDQPLSEVQSAFIRILEGAIVDPSKGPAELHETHRYELSDLGNQQAYIMSTMYRGKQVDAWRICANSQGASGDGWKHSLPDVVAALMTMKSKVDARDI